jgi:hypothetical protein
MTENWKDIEGFEGYYQVSDLGNVKSTRSGKILKPILINSGYLTVTLCVDYSKTTRLLHRLVAYHWIENPENKKEVNHKKGNKRDNRVSELEWSTPKGNVQHAKNILDVSSYREGHRNNRSKEVLQISLDGFLLHVHGSINEASRSSGLKAAHISESINNRSRRKNTGGYIWA